MMVSGLTLFSSIAHTLSVWDKQLFLRSKILGNPKVSFSNRPRSTRREPVTVSKPQTGFIWLLLSLQRCINCKTFSDELLFETVSWWNVIKWDLFLCRHFLLSVWNGSDTIILIKWECWWTSLKWKFGELAILRNISRTFFDVKPPHSE